MDQNKDFPTHPEQNLVQPETDETETVSNRRDLARRLGRFAAYAAPLTMLLLTDKAKAFSGPP